MDIKLLLNASSIDTVVPESQTPRLPLLEKTTWTPIAKVRPGWTKEEDRLLIELRQRPLSWDEVLEQFSGRSVALCRKRYEHIEHKTWSEERKRTLEVLYERYVQSNHCRLDTQC